MNQTYSEVQKIALAGIFLALAWLLPFFTGQVPEFGNMLLPMHIPAFLAGFILGPKYGLVLGFMMPLTRFLLFGMPPLYPTAISMAFELATFGFVAGILFQYLRKNQVHFFLSSYIALISAMLLGRLVYGVFRFFFGLFAGVFTFETFISSAFILAWPGILLQLILIPPLLKALDSANLIKS